jgi:hypothetical protein
VIVTPDAVALPVAAPATTEAVAVTVTPFAVAFVPDDESGSGRLMIAMRYTVTFTSVVLGP